MLITSVTSSVSAQKKVDSTGKWSLQTEQAPYEYNSGEIVIIRDGKEFAVKLVFGAYYELQATDVEYDKM